jgi:hypothetical protein
VACSSPLNLKYLKYSKFLKQNSNLIKFLRFLSFARYKTCFWGFAVKVVAERKQESNKLKIKKLSQKHDDVDKGSWQTMLKKFWYGTKIEKSGFQNGWPKLYH